MKQEPEAIADPGEAVPFDPGDFTPGGDPAEGGGDPAEGGDDDDDPAEGGGDPAEGGDDDDDPAEGGGDLAEGGKSAEPITDTEAERDAEFYIAMLDSLNVLILPGLYKGTMLTRAERIRIRQLTALYRKVGRKMVAAELGDDDRLLLEKFDDIEQLGDIVPFTDEEIESIKGPLAEVLIKYNLKGSPELRLAMALSLPMAQRLSPLLSLAI